MIVNLASLASDAALDSIGNLMSGGQIELLASNGVVLVRLGLSIPATRPAVDGELEFEDIRGAVAGVTGQAKFARVITAAGDEVFSCDVGDASSDAVVKLTPVLVTAGAPVALNSFRLIMP